MKEKIDKFLRSWISKKLLVFVIGTILCLVGKLTSTDFVTLAITYIAGQSVVDTVATLKGYKKN